MHYAARHPVDKVSANKGEMMKKNDIITVYIEDIGVDGEGIGKAEGMTFFIKDALPQDVVTAVVMKLKKTYGYARLLEILTPSPHRVLPLCPISRKCGGCQIQALSYEEQLRFKQNKIRNNLIRLGGFQEEQVDAWMEPMMGMDYPYRYRNKAQFPIGTDKEGNPIAGFYAGRTHSIIPVEDCYLGVEENRKILEILLSFMKEKKIPAYDEKSGRGLIRHVLIRCGFTTGEIMVCIVINGKRLPFSEALIERLSAISGMTSISLNFNTKQTNVILGEQVETLWGSPYVTDYIGDIKYRISPLSFFQVNPIQTAKLYQTALSYAGLTGEEAVWDLYCGIGTISLFLAQKAKKVYGVEIVPQAIADAKANAMLNGITNAEFFVGKAEEVLPEFYRQKSAEMRMGDGGESGKALSQNHSMLHPEVIVVDPPRKGCEVCLLATMAEMAPERIVYVSCDSATLARDLKYLCGRGYEVKKVRGVDQFGMTVHVETCVLLGRK